MSVLSPVCSHSLTKGTSVDAFGNDILDEDGGYEYDGRNSPCLRPLNPKLDTNWLAHLDTSKYLPFTQYLLIGGATTTTAVYKCVARAGGDHENLRDLVREGLPKCNIVRFRLLPIPTSSFQIRFPNIT